MKNEFFKNEEHNNSVTENHTYTEHKNIVETETIKEEFPSEENQNTSSQKKKKSTDLSMMTKIASFTMVAAAAVTIVVPTMNEVKVSVVFGDAIVTDTTVQYSVSLEMEKEVDVYLKVSNDFTNRIIALPEAYNSDTIENLKPDMSYSLEVMTHGSFGDKVLAKMDVKTLSESAWRTSKFNGVETECRCNKDGYFYFKMDFVDNIHAFTNFEAYLEDEFGNVSECAFTEALHEEQKIAIIDSELIGNTAKLYILCDVEDLSGTVTRTTMFQGTVAI